MVDTLTFTAMVFEDLYNVLVFSIEAFATEPILMFMAGVCGLNATFHIVKRLIHI